jgi:hypothetical protein
LSDPGALLDPVSIFISGIFKGVSRLRHLDNSVAVLLYPMLLELEIIGDL